MEEGNVLGMETVNLLFCSLFGLLRDLVCSALDAWLGIVVWYLVGGTQR